MAHWLTYSVGLVPLLAATVAVTTGAAPGPAAEATPPMLFAAGTATPSEECGVCHQGIYREFAVGFGSDLKYRHIIYRSRKDKLLTLPAQVSGTSTAHAHAGLNPFPIHAREVEEQGRSCNTCHFPAAFALPQVDTAEIPKPAPRAKSMETGGLTCASCHLTPDGKIRGPFEVSGPSLPHATVADPAMSTAQMCAYCHALGKRVPGKQTQTYLEWREDFHKPGLGRQECQDCHMPRTVRKSAEDFDVPVRAVARHLWTGGHSFQRLASALSVVAVQREKARPGLEFHVINVGAGHSVPTGSNRRGVYLRTEVMDKSGKVHSRREWLFAPWYGNRPDDRAFLEADKARPDAIAARQADSQGPHEPPIRAGEERVLSWTPALPPGKYTVRARLIYDLNRYNDRAFAADQTQIYQTSLVLAVGGEGPGQATPASRLPHRHSSGEQCTPRRLLPVGATRTAE